MKGNKGKLFLVSIYENIKLHCRLYIYIINSKQLVVMTGKSGAFLDASNEGFGRKFSRLKIKRSNMKSLEQQTENGS